MIQFVKGDLLESEAEALVNTVNTVGVMGKGIALQFREAFPENYRDYRDVRHIGNCHRNIPIYRKDLKLCDGRSSIGRSVQLQFLHWAHIMVVSTGSR